MSTDYHVLSRRDLTPHAYVLRTERKDLKFDAGQLVSLGPRGLGVNREYSIYSSESDPYLEFLIRKVNQGTVSLALAKLEPQSKVFILGPYSEFKIKNTVKNNRPHWLIATGTGIAPFHSMVKSHPNLNYKLIHGIRTADEMYDYEDYGSHYLPCVSSNASGAKVDAFKGRVTDYLKSASLPNDAVYYLCGNNKMITETYEILTSKGVKTDDINSEVFF